MIISQVIGGLGNQMFQYAAGRALAERHATDFRLDTRLFENYSLHNGFELGRIFEIDSMEATSSEIKNMIGWRSTRLGRRILRSKRLTFLAGRSYCIEGGPAFNDRVFSMPSDSYLSGYWQSDRYFDKECASLIREQFKFKLPLAGKNIELAENITSCSSVSLHVRRGDYVSNVGTNKVHGTCSMGYYEKAISYIEGHVENPIFFVFSDDIDWVKKSLNFHGSHYIIGHNIGLESYNDMRLMSFCKHNIIANSSFSWWGAWLNNNVNKLIVAPKSWMIGKSIDIDSRIPSAWIKLD